jgi:hypothetical protein
MTDKLIGYAIFNESKGDYLAGVIELEDGLILRGFGTIDQALIYRSVQKCQKVLADCNSGARLVKVFKNLGGLFHKSIT